jgi:hypothetical protein
MWKQSVVEKPHGCNSITWVFFEVNNNQLMDLFQNQFMRCWSDVKI